MINRSVRFLHLANWIAAAFLAFVVVVQWDEDSPLPAEASLTVLSWDDSSSVEEFRGEAEDFARENQITFAQEVVDLDERHAVRHFYLVDGDPSTGSDWLTGGYRDFSSAVTTRIDDFEELGNHTPIGRYYVFGDAAEAAELQGFFSEHGMEADVVRYGASRGVSMTVYTALAIMVFFTMAVVGAGVLSGVKAYGVGRLHGLSYSRLLFDDIRGAAGIWALSGIGVTALAAVAIGVYNGFSSPAAFFMGMIAVDLVLTTAALLANALVLALVMNVRIQSALKGELPGRSASTIAYSLRLAAVYVAISSAATAITTGLDVAERDRSYDAYERMGDIAGLELGNAYSVEDQSELDRVVGPWLRDQDREENVILVEQGRISSPDPGLNGRTVLYVNETFLAGQEIRMEDGGGYKGVADEGEIDVLVPAAFWGDRADLAEELSLEPKLIESAAEIVEYEPKAIADGQEFFTYLPPADTPVAAVEFTAPQAYVTDPVVVVLGEPEEMLTDVTYASAASRSELLLEDPSVVNDAVAADPKLARYVRAVVPVAEKAAAETQALDREFRISVFAAVIGALVVTITGIGVVLIHVKRNSQWIFARHTNGWRFMAVHRVILALETLVLLVLVGLIPYEVWSLGRQVDAYRQMGMPVPDGAVSMTAGQWAAIGLLAAVVAGGTLAALVRSHHRVVRGGVSEA